jgi:hypothetical protein
MYDKKKSYVDAAKGVKPPLPYSAKGLITGQRHYGPRVVNMRKTEVPVFIPPVEPPPVSPDAGCSIS